MPQLIKEPTVRWRWSYRARERNRSVAEHRLTAHLIDEHAIGIDEAAEGLGIDTSVGPHGLPEIDAEGLARGIVDVPA